MALPLLALIPTAISLAAKFAPSLIGLFKGDKAEERAREFVGIAQAVTGQQDPEQIMGAMSSNPEMAAQFQQQARDFELAIYREDTKRLETVNQTMRAELANGEKVENAYQFLLAFWKGGWRPYWGFVSGTAFGIQILGMMVISGLCVYRDPANSVVVINALATLAGALVATWALALTVLGVAVWKRSQDKQAAAGQETPGIFETIMSMVKK